MSESKCWYKLVFKQIQPIHIGSGRYGVLNETRIFIPGWTMWGALTKAYNIKKGANLNENKNLFENISCFWPCFDEKGENVLFPHYKNGDFYLGDYSEEKFRAMFVDTFVSTAIVPGSRMAKDESLHEINIILPIIKKDYRAEKNKSKLFWTGIIETNNEDVINFLEINKCEIFVGGDIRYGLGLIKLVNKIKLSSEKTDEFVKSNYLKFDLKHKKTGKLELLNEIQRDENFNFSLKNFGFYFMPDKNEKIENTNNFTLTKGKLEKKQNNDNQT